MDTQDREKYRQLRQQQRERQLHIIRLSILLGVGVILMFTGLGLLTYVHQQKQTATSGNVSDGFSEAASSAALETASRNDLDTETAAATEKAQKKKPSKEYRIVHSTEDETKKICVSEINYVEAQKHSSRIFINGQKEIMVKESLSQMEELLKDQDFVKSHRSYLCQLSKIHQIDKDTIIFDDGSRVPVSRRLYQEVNQKFIAFYRERQK